MPSIKKRIGYLPSPNIQEVITKIAKNEKLSQSKVVGILVEEALIARGLLNINNTKYLISKHKYAIKRNMDNSSIIYNDLEELISDKGITYNAKKYELNTDDPLSESTEEYNNELFEQFKQFIQFQKMIKEK
tara:strand:+ start:440 stop:835 length:396 start_codon:yes stop_codon:yes gene_type:complete